ncbi:MAG: TIGR04282 family arsenosugar biosynthesis glycosyltransferase [Pseudomonadota bacterium]|nr:TIGR04282 family arsenosugar biosynthesis glycosyltransferase [Pseudomonadota bacterium]
MKTETAIAIFARAPIPGIVKTRLIPALGAHGAAVLQEQLTERAVDTAMAAVIGPVILWATPNESHAAFHELARRFPIALAHQPDGDLGQRMLAAFEAGAKLVIGTDCPALTPAHLRDAATSLQDNDVAIIPAEDGGYVLIAMTKPQPALFRDIAWGGSQVMQETRRRASTSGLNMHEFAPLWDIDHPEDLDRLQSYEALAAFG